MGFFNNDDYKNDDYYNDDYHYDDQEHMSYGNYNDNDNWSAGEAVMFIATLYFVMQIVEVILVAIGHLVGFLLRMLIRFVKFVFRKGKEWYQNYSRKKKDKDYEDRQKQVL